MNYDVSNLDLLLKDAKKLDVCNDVIGICGHVRSVSFYKALVPGWCFCDYYERNTICKETHLDREG